MNLFKDLLETSQSILNYDHLLSYYASRKWDVIKKII